MTTTASDSASRADADRSAGPLLKATRLRKFYQLGRDPTPVLRDCDVSVQAGEFLAIMGKSGSGKSTLLHILGALDVPQEGQVLFENEPIFAPPGQRRFRTSALDFLSVAERRRNLLRRSAFGFVFQFYHLLPELTVLENTLLPHMVNSSVLGWRGKKAAAREAAIATLERMGLGHRLKHRPNELSGGERQRVALARALAHQPRVLFADEPTGNLDVEAGGNILNILRELHEAGQTIVMVTHDAGVASAADRILRLENGRLVPGG